MRRSFLVYAALAIAAALAWPAYIARSQAGAVDALLPTPAPVVADYLQRDQLVRFWEGADAERHRNDMLSPRQLAGQYLQRYRERGDVGDVLRAGASVSRSLAIQPVGNLSGELLEAQVFLTLHRFHEALNVIHDVEGWDRGDASVATREASLDLEVGDYSRAAHILDATSLRDRDDGWNVVESRYLELDGQLARARELLARASADANAIVDVPAEQRAWYPFREGEMAFEAGDNAAAERDERTALTIFPTFSDASRALARFECAQHAWRDCLRDATASAAVIPYPETLGYEADAERALGDATTAARTEGLIRTVERVGNAQRISDRLLAVYYADHGRYPADAYAIARRELAARDDIFTEDTLAWAAAADGRWNVARAAISRALRFDTENALLQYHAGAIALHFGERAEARRRFERALALNPAFHPVYADEARASLANLRGDMRS